ncbi:hypothetical protein J22TS3_47900 [Paenibacillus sp. J22TS3]|nr:hypothetical protein J22TS3_47900 [Paenibacillus sp. J22TS3]
MFGGGLPVEASNRKSDKQTLWATIDTNFPTDATRIWTELQKKYSVTLLRR